MKKSLWGVGIVIAVLTTVLSGCATMFSGTTQTIHVQAINSATHNAVSGAQCTIDDGKGRHYIVSGNPGSVIVTRGRGALQVHCRAPGYNQKAVGAGQSFNAWTVADVLFWPGALVDAMSGAITKYPNYITVLMQKSGSSSHTVKHTQK